MADDQPIFFFELLNKLIYFLINSNYYLTEFLCLAPAALPFTVPGICILTRPLSCSLQRLLTTLVPQ